MNLLGILRNSSHNIVKRPGEYVKNGQRIKIFEKANVKGGYHY